MTHLQQQSPRETQHEVDVAKRVALAVFGLHWLTGSRQNAPGEAPDRTSSDSNADDTYISPNATFYDQMIAYSVRPSQGSELELRVRELRRERANRHLEALVEVHGSPKLPNGWPMCRRIGSIELSSGQSCAVGTIGLLDPSDAASWLTAAARGARGSRRWSLLAVPLVAARRPAGRCSPSRWSPGPLSRRCPRCPLREFAARCPLRVAHDLLFRRALFAARSPSSVAHDLLFRRVPPVAVRAV